LVIQGLAASYKLHG